ncbi:MAG: hypothetical protein ACOX1J_02365 [Dethiobacteria bacterium]
MKSLKDMSIFIYIRRRQSPEIRLIFQQRFHDLTSSYFEGSRCIIAEYGYSRDRRKGRKQIVIGVGSSKVEINSG